MLGDDRKIIVSDPASIASCNTVPINSAPRVLNPHRPPAQRIGQILQRIFGRERELRELPARSPSCHDCGAKLSAEPFESVSSSSLDRRHYVATATASAAR
jgi:hypothetical protein